MTSAILKPRLVLDAHLSFKKIVERHKSCRDLFFNDREIARSSARPRNEQEWHEQTTHCTTGRVARSVEPGAGISLKVSQGPLLVCVPEEILFET